MKTTSREYVDQKHTELFRLLGCFFAFSPKQFDEGYESAQVEKPVKYVHVGHGLCCPKPNVDKLLEGFEAIKNQWLADRKKAQKIQLQFVGIDNWNRPVWRTPDRSGYYGSVNELFSEGATEEEVREKVDIYDLCYFGTHFGCEPMGTSVEDKYYL